MNRPRWRSMEFMPRTKSKFLNGSIFAPEDNYKYVTSENFAKFPGIGWVRVKSDTGMPMTFPAGIKAGLGLRDDVS